MLDKETGKPMIPDRPGQTETPDSPEVNEEELRRMSAFTDFINDLDLDDFGKPQAGV